MLITFYDSNEGINILKNSDLISKIDYIKNKYKMKEEDIISLLNEFSIGIFTSTAHDCGRELNIVSNLLENGHNVFSISNKLKCSEMHVRNTIRKSPQLQNQLYINNIEFNISKKYGDKVLNEIKKLKSFPDIYLMTPSNMTNDIIDLLPLDLFRDVNKFPEFFMSLDGISESKLGELFALVGRHEDFIKYKENKKIKYVTREKTKIENRPDIQTIYENSNESVNIRTLSEEFNISYHRLCSIKRAYNWTKKVHNSKFKDTSKEKSSNKLHKISQLYFSSDETIYGLSIRYKMAVLSVVAIIKDNCEAYNIDYSTEIKSNKRKLLKEVPELFIDAKLSINKIAFIFNLSEFEVKRILEKYIGTFPENVSQYDDNIMTNKWTEFQLEFLSSDLTDKELSEFLHKPISIIKAKRKDYELGKIKYYKKIKRWSTIYNQLIKGGFDK